MSKCPVCGSERGTSLHCSGCDFRDIVPAEGQRAQYDRMVQSAREKWRAKQKPPAKPNPQDEKAAQDEARREARERAKQAAALQAQEELRAKRDADGFAATMQKIRAAQEAQAKAKHDGKAKRQRQQEAQAKKEQPQPSQSGAQSAAGRQEAREREKQAAALQAQEELRLQREREQKAQRELQRKQEAEARKKREAEEKRRADEQARQAAKKEPKANPEDFGKSLLNAQPGAAALSVEAGIAQQMAFAKKRLADMETGGGYYRAARSPKEFLSQLEFELQKEALSVLAWNDGFAARARGMVERALASRAAGKVRFLGVRTHRTTEKRGAIQTQKVSRSADGMQLLGAGQRLELFYQMADGRKAAFSSQQPLPRGLWTLETRVQSQRLCLFARSANGRQVQLCQCDAWTC